MGTELESYGPVEAMVQGKPLLGLFAPLMHVRLFAIDGLLVDTGISTWAAQTVGFARRHTIHTCALTHHHEDHSGGVAALGAAGVRVFGSVQAQSQMVRGWTYKPYQLLAWARAPLAEIELIEETIETDHYRFDVVDAGGHSADQVALHEPNEGWLFSGDAFISDRVKIFRGDEDFARSLATLRRLADLDFDSLFCAHFPKVTGGRDAMRRKLAHFEELEGRTLDLAARGWSIRAITDELLGAESILAFLVTLGDASKYNLIRSILDGPVLRE